MSLNRRAVFFSMVWCALFLCGTASALDFKISATRKTASRRLGSQQQLPKQSTRLVSKEVFYRFDITRISTQMPERLTVEWVIIKEQANGQLGYGNHGSIDKTFPFGQEISIESDAIELAERQFSRGGSVEQDIEGYALRILDGDTVLTEKYEPTSVEDLGVWLRVDEAKAKEAREKQEERPKRRFKKNRMDLNNL